MNSYHVSIKFENWDELNPTLKNDREAHIHMRLNELFDTIIVGNLDFNMGTMSIDINETKVPSSEANQHLTQLGTLMDFKILDLQEA